MALEAPTVGLAGRRPAQPFEPVDGDRSGREARERGDERADSPGHASPRGEDPDPVAVDHDVRRVTACGQVALDIVEVDAQAEDLRVAVDPADDLPQPVVRLAGQVAGAQLVSSGPRARSSAVCA